MQSHAPSDTNAAARDHGGGLDMACSRFGGTRADWLDLSTGINPDPYPLPQIPTHSWTSLPDRHAQMRLEAAARQFWRVPRGADILAAPGASALIARIPALHPPARVHIPTPTYNEHAAAFAASSWQISDLDGATARVLVHPNNPDGRLWTAADISGSALTVIDESFCDICPDRSLVAEAARPGVIVLKSFGKFWGLGGVRLGFAIAAPETIASLSDMLGPWPVSGPALAIGAAALEDDDWAAATRARLSEDANRLDALMRGAGAGVVGGTPLFRLYDVQSAALWQDRLARHRIWTRIFPYSDRWLRLGLPPAEGWARLEAAL